MPDPTARQSAIAGDHSIIYQVYGNNNSIGAQPRLKLIGPPRERPPQPVGASDEAALLVYREEVTAFVGRDGLLEEHLAWATAHDSARPVSVRVLTGDAGTGKTRFALELCRALG